MFTVSRHVCNCDSLLYALSVLWLQALLHVCINLYGLMFIAVLSDQGPLKLWGVQHPQTSFKLKQQIEYKQLKATSVLIKQTDSRCEQGR